MPSPSSKFFAKGLLGLLVISTVGLGCIYWHIYGPSKLFGDFDIFYQASRHVIEHRLSAVYDTAHIRQLLARGNLTDFPYFLNPPLALFIFYPLGLFPEPMAFAFFTMAQVVMLWFVLRTEYVYRLFGSPSPLAIKDSVVLAIPFFAFSLQNILFGQVGLLCTTLFIGVLALRHTRPILAGIVLGIFAFKPQLGVLLPVLLVAERNVKTLLAALITALLLAVLSLLLWGPGLWENYLEMAQLRARFLSQDMTLLFTISTSPYAAMRNMGISPVTAFGCQIALAVAIIQSLWPALQKGEESFKILIITLATYLVTPYSLVYDIPLLAIPCALLLRRAEADQASMPELIALLLLIALPLVAIVLQIDHIPYSVVAIGFALGVARRLPMREKVIYG